VKVAWLSLAAGDNDLACFLICLIAAWQTIAPQLGEATLAALQSSQPPPIDILLTALLNDLTSLGDVILVLDDYHVIESPAAPGAVVLPGWSSSEPRLRVRDIQQPLSGNAHGFFRRMSPPDLLKI
jgi:hypothetical protein